MGANAQTIVPTFTAGQVLTAAQQNQINTGVPVFATTAARDAAFGGAGEKTLAEGQMCYIEAAPQRFQVYNGTVWRDFDINYSVYTPSLNNVTLGNGSISGVYARLGEFVVGGFNLTFGSTTSVSGLIGIGLPFSVLNSATNIPGFPVWLGDSGTNTFIGTGQPVPTTSRIDIYAQNASSTYVFYGFTSATVPFTWTTNDSIYGTFTYRQG